MIGKSHLKAALIGTGAAVLVGIAPAGAAEMDDLKAKVEALEKRLSTSVSIGGFVKGDFYIDSHEDRGQSFGNGATVRTLGANKVEGDDDGAVGAHARQSRLRIGTSTDTDYGALSTVVEGHFWGGTLGLRHAYGALGPVLAGRAWSIRGDDHTFADTVDFDGPAGVVATRKAQLRLTLPLAEGFYGQLAVEPAISGNEVPTFLAALRYSSGWGAVNVTGAVGQHEEGGQNVTAHTLHVGAHLNATKATRVMATLNMTRGDAQIYGSWYDGGNISSATGTDASDDLKAYDSIGGFAGVSHGWSDSIRSGVYYGWVRNDKPDMAVDKTVQTLHANVIWSPVPQADIGFEFMYGSRETNGGEEGEATRFQIGVKYNF